MRMMSVTGNRGFTLLELLVVLTILVLIAAAWPLASSHVFAAQQLRNESQQLAGAIRLAQMTARTTGVPQELTISPGGTAYQVGSSTHELARGVAVHIRGESQAMPPARFLFFPDGSSRDATLVISLEEHTATLRILPITGRLELDP
jgi:prepilin-type N-terminal cleavage/methylation domain-containing protein